jgi:hypothetical protein
MFTALHLLPVTFRPVGIFRRCTRSPLPCCLHIVAVSLHGHTHGPHSTPPLPLAPVCDFATNVSYSHPSCAQCNNVSNYFDGSCSVAGINTTASCPPGECPTSPNVPSAMFPFCESTYVAVAASPHDPFPAKEECQRWPQLISPLSHKLTATGRFIFILLCLVGGLQEWRQTRSSTHAA